MSPLTPDSSARVPGSDQVRQVPSHEPTSDCRSSFGRVRFIGRDTVSPLRVSWLAAAVDEALSKYLGWDVYYHRG
jgi:hypothetical protein